MSDPLANSRLKALQVSLSDNGLDAVIVPRADEYQNEYVRTCDERLRAISGFTGTAGTAVVTTDKAAIFLDGRYTTQGAQQTDQTIWELCHFPKQRPSDWVVSNLTQGAKIGFDPLLHRPEEIETYEKKGFDPVALDFNPVDAIWPDRPEPVTTPITLRPEDLTGESARSKIERIAAALSEQNADALIISAPDNLSWLFNIRGVDLEMTPVVLARGLLTAQGKATLFIEPDRVSTEQRKSLSRHGIELADPSDLETTLAPLSPGSTILVDKMTANVWLRDLVGKAGHESMTAPDPVTLAKAQKNPAELDGMRHAHLLDGVAITRFLAWFETNAAPGMSEADLADRLFSFRQEAEDFRSSSFATISACDANAALPHYQHDPKSSALLKDGSVYLFDSGGQYESGTTDITRVICLGTPSPKAIRRYTQVLKGHIAISMARFPKGVTGAQLDPFARQFLWQDGVDFDHGTGHGVGAYLSVHEGPQSISSRGDSVPLMPGMVISNEPGYYKPGAFGIRIENLVVVQKVSKPPSGSERELYEFETITLAPYERRLIDMRMLNPDESNWIDRYHSLVMHELSPILDESERSYLKKQTAPLSRRQ